MLYSWMQQFPCWITLLFHQRLTGTSTRCFKGTPLVSTRDNNVLSMKLSLSFNCALNLVRLHKSLWSSTVSPECWEDTVSSKPCPWELPAVTVFNVSYLLVVEDIQLSEGILQTPRCSGLSKQLFPSVSWSSYWPLHTVNLSAQSQSWTRETQWAPCWRGWHTWYVLENRE